MNRGGGTVNRGGGTVNRSGGATKRVDVIIAAHSDQRPVGQAAASVVRGNPEAHCVVVAHNLPAAEIARAIPEDVRAEVEILELPDGIPSPSGPFNHGIAVSEAEFVSILGSDDHLDPGAVANWLTHADRSNADAVITRLVRGGERVLVRSPMVRPTRRGRMDIVRDRLPYRSAPLGLVRRSAVADFRLELTPGARSGGDLEFVTRLWALGRVVYAGTGPGYVEMPGAQDRVTHVMKPVGEELDAAMQLVASSWFRKQPARVRRAVAVKLLRRNLVDTIRKRTGSEWSATETRDLAEIARAFLGAAPHTRALLSSRERALLTAVQEEQPATFPTLVARAKNYRSLTALIGPHPASAFHPAGALRFALAGAAMR